MTTIKGTKTPKKFSTQLSEGSWGYGGGTRVYKSKLPTIKNTYTNPKPVKHITEVQRVKAQILKDKTNPKTEIIKGKVIGKVRQNWGKWKPVYQKKTKKDSKKIRIIEVYGPE